MKGVILAGGLGTRLHPLTRITNKHLLPVYDRPMILYPLETLRNSGITDILVVCGREHAGHFMNFLGSGKEYGVKLSYALQDINNGGIADALSYAKDFAESGPLALILGDNIFEHNFEADVRSFKTGARGFLKRVPDAHRFASPIFSRDGKRVLRFKEKPTRPQYPYALVGFYLFDAGVFNVIRTLKPSSRGELEITDTVNHYVARGSFSFRSVRGWWLDAGTFESLGRAAAVVRKQRIRNSTSL